MNGLDTGYFRKNLERILRDLESYTPEEMETALTRLASVSNSQRKIKVMSKHEMTMAAKHDSSCVGAFARAKP